MGTQDPEDRANFEAGDEAVEVKRKPRAGVVVSARLSPEEADRLSDIAESRGKTISQVAREALSNYLQAAAVTSSSASSPVQVMIAGRGIPDIMVTSGGGGIARTRGHVSEPRMA